MAVPKKKVSKTRTHRRYGAWKTSKLKKIDKKYVLVKCKNCGKYKLSYRVCPHCGYYKGKQVVNIKVGGPKTVEA